MRPAPCTRQVFQPSGDNEYSSDDEAEGSHQLAASEEGRHAVCFFNHGTEDGTPTSSKSVWFSFEKGFAATDFEDVAKKKHIEPVEVRGWGGQGCWALCRERGGGDRGRRAWRDDLSSMRTLHSSLVTPHGRRLLL
jgi:hypothetical protein